MKYWRKTIKLCPACTFSVQRKNYNAEYVTLLRVCYHENTKFGFNCAAHTKNSLAGSVQAKCD